MHRRRPLVLTAAVAALVFSLLAAGCGGGGSSPGVANIGSTTTSTTTAQSGLVAYAHCMRGHGVSGFPDPDSTGGIPKAQVVAAAQGNPTKFDSAQTACSHLLPADGSLGPPETPQQARTKLADELSFARCMRSHGVTRFPDPTSQGQLTIAMVEAQGIDVHSPAILRVVQSCLPASHGALTPAKVREAINGNG
jgi:hypothetical protein